MTQSPKHLTRLLNVYGGNRFGPGASLESCISRSLTSQHPEMQTLGLMIMKLMNKKSKEGGVLGINDPDCWPR